MKMTKHAEIRKRQRGFSNHTIDYVLRYGRIQEGADGAMKLFIGKKEYQKVIRELKRDIQLMDRAKGKNVIIKDDYIITVY